MTLLLIGSPSLTVCLCPRPCQLYVKLRCDDAALLEHVDQLLGELHPGAEEVGSDDEDPPLDNIGDDFVQSSDEEAAMEH